MQSTPEADAIFASYFRRAENLVWAAGVVTGDLILSVDEVDRLARCPAPARHGHLAFRRVKRRVYFHPATEECRQMVRIIRLWQLVISSNRPPTIREWMERNDPEMGLVEVYGDPARGFAGAYVRLTK